MIAKGAIESVCVLEKSLSVRLTVFEMSPEATENLRTIKGERQEFSLALWGDNNQSGGEEGVSEITFQGTICSINLRKDLHCVIHLEKIKALIFEVIEIMDFPVAFKFMSAADRELSSLVDETARALSLSGDEVIYRESSFINQYGRLVEGKRSVLDLSERQKPIIAIKLKRFLKNRAGNRETKEESYAGKTDGQAV